MKTRTSPKLGRSNWMFIHPSIIEKKLIKNLPCWYLTFIHFALFTVLNKHNSPFTCTQRWMTIVKTQTCKVFFKYKMYIPRFSKKLLIITISFYFEYIHICLTHLNTKKYSRMKWLTLYLKAVQDLTIISQTFNIAVRVIPTSTEVVFRPLFEVPFVVSFNSLQNQRAQIKCGSREVTIVLVG